MASNLKQTVKALGVISELRKMAHNLRAKGFTSMTLQRPNRRTYLLVSYKRDDEFGDRVLVSTGSDCPYDQFDQVSFTLEEIEQLAAFVKKAKKIAASVKKDI